MPNRSGWDGDPAYAHPGEYAGVAAIGGGAVGLAHAIRIKRDNPELRVLVLETASPGIPGWDAPPCP
jgi:hypothetical protein